MTNRNSEVLTLHGFDRDGEERQAVITVLV
jgi:hypothetical protein